MSSDQKVLTVFQAQKTCAEPAPKQRFDLHPTMTCVADSKERPLQ